MRRVLPLLLWLSAAALGCEKDPHDAQTWIDKLDDPREVDEAIRNLERLKDPKAIKPLGELWRKLNRPSKVLRVIGAIAQHADAGGKPHYQDAIPIFKEAIENFDPADERSIDDARFACDLIGKAGDASAVDLLIKTAQKPMPRLSPANQVRIAAVKALGKFKDPRAVDVLIKILQTDPANQHVSLHYAAANALGETGDPRGLEALKQALIFVGPIYKAVRSGITRVGKPAVPAMRQLFLEKDADIAKMARDKKLSEKAPGVLVFKGAALLGDLRAKEAVPELLAGLRADARVSYYDEKTGAPGPPTHNAILDALKKIGDPSAANAVWAYASDAKTDDAVRPFAIDTYSWLGNGRDALPKLLEWIKDDNAEDSIKITAIVTYGRLGRSQKDAKELDPYIQKYEAKIKAAEDKIKNAKSDADKAAGEDEKAVASQWKQLYLESRYRIETAVECKEDPMCYAKKIGDKDVQANKPGLPKAERALVELFKMGDKGRPALDELLKHADTSERILRDGINLALPRIAPKPCKPCADRLGTVLEQQSSQTTLDALNDDTKIVYHYFLWAGS
jgi:hypothetical protein